MGDGPAYDDGVLRITRTGPPSGLAIAGEIDESTYPALVTTLGELTRGQHEVHVHLGDVVYCDLAGLRAIVRLAGPAGQGDASRRVVLHQVPAQLRAVLEIIGWDSVPGLSLDQQGASPAGH
jgi:ABC-type transporter Mla MlaB component